MYSRRAVPTHRSAKAFAFGACGGVRRTSIPAAVNVTLAGSEVLAFDRRGDGTACTLVSAVRQRLDLHGSHCGEDAVGAGHGQVVDRAGQPVRDVLQVACSVDDPCRLTPCLWCLPE